MPLNKQSARQEAQTKDQVRSSRLMRYLPTPLIIFQMKDDKPAFCFMSRQAAPYFCITPDEYDHMMEDGKSIEQLFAHNPLPLAAYGTLIKDGEACFSFSIDDGLEETCLPTASVQVEDNLPAASVQVKDNLPAASVQVKDDLPAVSVQVKVTCQAVPIEKEIFYYAYFEDISLPLGRMEQNTTGQDKALDSGQYKGLDNGQDKEQDSGQDKELDNGQDKEQDSGQDKELDNGQDRELDSGQYKGPDNGKAKAGARREPGTRKRIRDIEIRTFGHFDVFVNGEPVLFPSRKAKELLALLVDRRGGYVTSEEAISYLWPEESCNKITQSRYRKVAMRLKNTLEDHGIEDIIKTVKGNRCINRDAVSCDLYHYLSGNPQYADLFKGSYLLNYDWAKTTQDELAQTTAIW